MIMFGIVARKGVNNSDLDIAKMIIINFTCQLRNWWEQWLTKQVRQEIKNARKVLTLQHGAQLIQTSKLDVVNILLCAIYSHFVGDVASKENRNEVLRLNLRCITLSDLELYKDIFLIRVSEREYCRCSI